MSSFTNHYLHETLASDSPLNEHQLVLFRTLRDLSHGGDSLLSVTVTEGAEDKVPVIMVDTSDDLGPFRIAINDGPIWDADPSTHHHAECNCTHDQGEPDVTEPITHPHHPANMVEPGIPFKVINVTVNRMQQTEVKVPLDFPVGKNLTSDALLDIIGEFSERDTDTLSITTSVVSEPAMLELNWTVTRPVRGKIPLAKLTPGQLQRITLGHTLQAYELTPLLMEVELESKPDELYRVLTHQSISPEE